MIDAVEVSLFQHRLASLCDEMGARLRRAAISPNIRDRLDFSCAIFDARGELLAQAAHIPVHLGSMAFAMREIVQRFAWREGDVVVFNDPFAGGTHLPDVTLVVPLFARRRLVGFAGVRAHHADIGGVAPGSMGRAQSIEDEGVLIPPMHWFAAGKERPELFERLAARVRTLDERRADLAAQLAAARVAAERISNEDPDWLAARMRALDALAEGYGRAAIDALADGVYAFSDWMDDDGLGDTPVRIEVAVEIDGDRAVVDFSGTSKAVSGPINCPLSVTVAAVWYVFRCLMPAHAPTAAGVFRPIEVKTKEGMLVHAPRGVAVAAGNVETSQRIVDVLLGALAKAVPDRIPAAAQGTMNNIAFAGDGWTHYETLAGGMGAHAAGDGAGPVQCHMTNTRLASAEVLESYAPLRVVRCEVRRGSGGQGKHRGGDGMIREWEALAPCRVAWLTERRKIAPWGLAGGKRGKPGRNLLRRASGQEEELPPKGEAELGAGDRIVIETPGGGGWGRP